jgi:hypothetical protein
VVQRVDQLIQEHCHTVVDPRRRRRPNRSRSNLRSAPPDDFFPMCGDEFVEHQHFQSVIVCVIWGGGLSRTAHGTYSGVFVRIWKVTVENVVYCTVPM